MYSYMICVNASSWSRTNNVLISKINFEFIAFTNFAIEANKFVKSIDCMLPINLKITSLLTFETCKKLYFYNVKTPCLTCFNGKVFNLRQPNRFKFKRSKVQSTFEKSQISSITTFATRWPCYYRHFHQLKTINATLLLGASTFCYLLHVIKDKNIWKMLLNEFFIFVSVHPATKIRRYNT